MADRSKFEAMLEALINEDQDAAKEIFHDIVVEKSREIYESLLATDFAEEVEEDDVEELESDDVDSEDEDDSEDMDFDSEDDEESDEESEEDEGEVESDDIEDRMIDVESALAELQAEFEEMLAGEKAEEADHPGIHDMGGADVEDESEIDLEKPELDEFSQFMEYVTKVSLPKHGDDGVQKKSVFNKDKYNDMGGSTANIAAGGVADAKGTKGGLLDPSTEDLKSGNVNVPGNSKASLNKVKAQSSAEKSVNTQSPIRK